MAPDRFPEPEIAAAIAAAFAALLDEERAAPEGDRWAGAARPAPGGAGAPWPAGRVGWAAAERPR